MKMKDFILLDTNLIFQDFTFNVQIHFFLWYFKRGIGSPSVSINITLHYASLILPGDITPKIQTPEVRHGVIILPHS